MKYIIVLIFIIILSGCTKDEVNENVFRYNEANGIENLDFVAASNYATNWPLQQLGEGLMEYTKDMQLIPNLAESYDISSDGMTYTFKLRKNVFFHDDACFPDGKGREVKASDFKYCFERLCDPRTKTRGAWIFRDRVKGAVEYINSIQQNKNDVNEIIGFQVPDDYTLVIILSEPFAPFLSILTMQYSFVYPKEAVDHYKENFGYHPVGTGPYKFSKWEFDRELELVRNDNYWRKEQDGQKVASIDAVKVSFIRSSETTFLDFRDGKFDYYDPSPEVLSQITDESGNLLPQYEFEMIKQPWLNTVYLAVQLNTELPGGKNNVLSTNKKLRQAINYAIDRQRIIDYVLKFKGKPGINGPIPPGMPGFSEGTVGYNYDKQKAIQLLNEAGYPGGSGLTIKLAVSNEDTQKLIGETVQAQLREIGIDVQLDFIQGSTMRSSQVGGELAFWRANWGADYFDPENFMALLYSKNKTPNGPNYTHYSNPAADELYERGIRETDFSVRKDLYNQMEKIVMEDSPWMIIYYNEILYLKNKNVKNMYIDGLNTLIIKWANKE